MELTVPAAPIALGLPQRFSTWRKDQRGVIQQVCDSKARCVVLCAPTGSGKTVIYMALAKLLHPEKTMILTSSRGLQDQLEREFGVVGDGDMGMAKLEDRWVRAFCDIRGMANYECREGAENCGEGDCLKGRICDRRTFDPNHLGEQCFYFEAYDVANNAMIVSTNYSYWLGVNTLGRGIGHMGRDYSCLILDEAHKTEDLVFSFFDTKLTEGDLSCGDGLLGLPGQDADLDDWAAWAWSGEEELTALSKEGSRNGEGTADGEGSISSIILKLRGKLAKIGTANKDDWMMESGTLHPYGRWRRFAPIRITQGMRFSLLRDIKRVVMVSATATKETAKAIGFKEDEIEVIEVASTFPVENRPFIWVPNSPTFRVNYKATLGEQVLWVRAIDRIIEQRLLHKGIIHTVSYARARFLMERSEFSSIMMTHERGSIQAQVKMFKAADSPCILVSPCATEGYDFPDDDCRWQILGKLPFPDLRSGPEHARSKLVKRYGVRRVADVIAQSYGRGVRHDADYCECFVVDDGIDWFMRQNKDLFPGWFTEAYKVSRMISDEFQEERDILG